MWQDKPVGKDCSNALGCLKIYENTGRCIQLTSPNSEQVSDLHFGCSKLMFSGDSAVASKPPGVLASQLFCLDEK
jgi:hypothetical protein